MFLQQLVNGLTLGGIYALIAVGYTMVYGVIELINFAHGELYMLGAFVALTCLTVLDLPFFPSVGIALVVVAGCGVAIDALAYRPLRAAPRLTALIAALGVSLFLQNMARLIWGAYVQRFPDERLPAAFGQPLLSIGGVTLSTLQVGVFVVMAAAMLGLHLFVTRTRTGTAMRACAQDRVAAGLMGIPLNRIVGITFALGSAMGALAGIMVGLYYNAIYPTMGYIAGVKAFAAAVLGGIGHIPGTMVAGILLGIGETFGAAYVSSPYRDGIAYAVMILVILVRPSGLLGVRGGP